MALLSERLKMQNRAWEGLGSTLSTGKNKKGRMVGIRTKRGEIKVDVRVVTLSWHDPGARCDLLQEAPEHPTESLKRLPCTLSCPRTERPASSSV